MLKFKEYIEEARRNPDMNPRISAYDALLPYHDDPNIYISMTDIDKIGINPLSKYNTPLGIYSYPLREAWLDYNIGSTQSLKDLPFAGKRPFIWILRAKQSDGFVDDMYVDYGSNNYDTDVRLLEKIFNKYSPIKKQFVSYDHDLMVQDTDQKIELYTNMIADAEPDPNDPAQVNLIAKFEAKLKQYQKYRADLETETILTWDELEELALGSAKVKNSVMSFWNLSRLLANRITGEEPLGIKSATMWNSILRQCGYTGFADKSSMGYIHPSEPMQAVFLTRNAFEVVDKIDNKDYNKIEINSFTTMMNYIDGISNAEKKNSAVADFLQFLVSKVDKSIKYHLPSDVKCSVPVYAITSRMGYTECLRFVSRLKLASYFADIKRELTLFKELVTHFMSLRPMEKADILSDIDVLISGEN